MTDLMTPSAQRVCDELTPQLQDFAREAGLADNLARSLSLTWDGNTFLVVSPLALDAAEYGDGLGPAPRPIHKAMNRLEPEAAKLMENLLDEQMQQLLEGVL